MSLQHAHQSSSDIFLHLQSALDRALANMRANEPQLVANLVVEITNSINTAIKSIFANYNLHISASGVFVHQRPLVKSRKFPRPKPAAVEIGDLLLVIKHQQTNGSISRNALLLQAKKGNVSSKRIHQNQYHLYAFWPKFKYVMSNPLVNNQIRHVTGPNMYNGSKYLFLIDHIELITVFPTEPLIPISTRFIIELYNFLFMNAGRSFVYQPPGNNINWDQVITDLLDITSNGLSTYMHRAGSPYSERGVKCFLTGELSGSTWDCSVAHSSAQELYVDAEKPPTVPETWGEGDGEGGGISTIEFTIVDKDIIK